MSSIQKNEIKPNSLSELNTGLEIDLIREKTSLEPIIDETKAAPCKPGSDIQFVIGGGKLRNIIYTTSGPQAELAILDSAGAITQSYDLTETQNIALGESGPEVVEFIATKPDASTKRTQGFYHRLRHRHLTAPSLPTSYTMQGGTETILDEGGMWLNGLRDGLDWGDVLKEDGNARGTTISLEGGPNNDSCACLNPTRHAIPADQEVIVTVWKPDGGFVNSAGYEIEIFLRCTMGPNWCRTYEILIPYSGAVQIPRWNGLISTPVTFQDDFINTDSGSTNHGDQIRARIVGSIIRVYKTPFGGSEFQIAFCDTASGANDGANRILTGSPGHSYFVRPPGPLGKFGISSWTAHAAT